jgi:hypothetical protein
MAIGSTWYPVKVSGTFVAALYAAFGLGDLVFSLAAFHLGIPEGNPVLRWACLHGWFVPAKLALTLAVAFLINLLYGVDRVRAICWGAVAAMAFVDAVHAISLTVLLPG